MERRVEITAAKKKLYMSISGTGLFICTLTLAQGNQLVCAQSSIDACISEFSAVARKVFFLTCPQNCWKLYNIYIMTSYSLHGLVLEAKMPQYHGSYWPIPQMGS